MPLHSDNETTRDDHWAHRGTYIISTNDSRRPVIITKLLVQYISIVLAPSLETDGSGIAIVGVSYRTLSPLSEVSWKQQTSQHQKKVTTSHLACSHQPVKSSAISPMAPQNAVPGHARPGSERPCNYQPQQTINKRHYYPPCQPFSTCSSSPLSAALITLEYR